MIDGKQHYLVEFEGTTDSVWLPDNNFDGHIAITKYLRRKHKYKTNRPKQRRNKKNSTSTLIETQKPPPPLQTNSGRTINVPSKYRT